MAVRGLALAVTVMMLLSGCGAARSPQTFCDTLGTYQSRYASALAEAQESLGKGGLGGVVEGAQRLTNVLGDLQPMWDELAEKAPDEIQADAKIVRDTNAEQVKSIKEKITDPVALAGSLLTSGVMNSGSYQRLNDYAAKHCGGGLLQGGAKR